MFKSDINIRVRYAETDRMGYVYYGNYAQYFEVGRVEALRELGLSYKELEDSGILLPVYAFNVKYLKPAFYDDMLTIRTMIKEIPGARIEFEYETYSDKKELLNRGATTLVFINRLTGKPCSAPAFFMESMRKYFEEK